jgi:hypothetical protein
MSGSDDRIDVVVTDGVDPNVALKLNAIADSADRGQASVLKLKAELAAITATPVQKLAAETETATATINKQLSTQSALAKATDASAASDVKAATTKGSLTAAIDAEAAAQARLAAVIDKTIARQEAANAAAASTTFAKGGNPFQGEANLAAQAASVGSAAKAMEASVVESEVATVSSFGRIKNAALNAFDFLRDALYAQGAKFQGFLGAGGVATIENEAGAIEKVGTTVKTNSRAITESLVLVREGMRGNFTRMAGSASILAGALGILNAAIPVAIAGLVGFAAAKISLNTQAEQDHLKAYAESLGLTEKEMRKLKDTTVDASGALKSHNDLQITFGDVFHGVVKTIEDGVKSIGDYYGVTSQEAADFTSNAITFLKDFFSYMVGGVYATGKFIYTEVVNIFTLAYDTGRVAGNAIYVMYATLANGVIALFNGVATIANAVSNGLGKGDVLTKMEYLDGRLGNITNGLKGFKGEDFFGDVRNGAQATNKVLDQTAKNIRGAADARVKAEADAIKANRNPAKAKHDPKTKEDYLDDTNKKLDDELSRMSLLKDAREEQQRLDQIEEEFQKRRQPLTQAEIDGFKKKIDAIIQYKYQQAEMDRIYEQVSGPQRTYNATIAAANDLQSRGVITTAQYKQALADATLALANSKGPTDSAIVAYDTLQDKLAQIAVWQENFVKSNGKFGISQAEAAQQTNIANRAYQEAIDPLFQMKNAMTDAMNAAKLYGDEVQQNAYYQQIRNQLLQKGIVISPTYVAGINAQVDALMNQNKQLQLQQKIQSTVANIVNPMLQDREMLSNKQKYYDELNRMADQYNLSEAQRAQARYALEMQFNQNRLQAMSDTFGQLAQLSSSGNKKLAMIGKAAAIAQATIDGIMAVQKALASAPPPWNVIEAGVIGAMTGVNVAKIISTPVGSYRDGGDFIVQGNAGIDKNNINMDVSRGERVTIQTPEQQRQAAKGGGAAKPVLVQPKIVNIIDPKMALDAMSSRDGDGVIMNFIERNASQIQRVLS